MKSKKGLSGVITAVIMIALVLAASAIIWVAVNNLLKDRLDSSGACFDIMEKLTLNRGYTCYDAGANELRVSIERSDINLSEIQISLASPDQSQTIKLPTSVDYIRFATDEGYNNQSKTMPSVDSSRTYVIDIAGAGLGDSSPDSVTIYPVVRGNKCGASDKISSVENCALLA